MDLVGSIVQMKATMVAQQISMGVLSMSLDAMKMQGLASIELLKSSTVDISNLSTSGRNFDISI